MKVVPFEDLGGEVGGGEAVSQRTWWNKQKRRRQARKSFVEEEEGAKLQEVQHSVLDQRDACTCVDFTFPFSLGGVLGAHETQLPRLAFCTGGNNPVCHCGLPLPPHVHPLL